MIWSLTLYLNTECTYSVLWNTLYPMMLCGEFKAEDYSCRAQWYASLHSHFLEYLSRT